MAIRVKAFKKTKTSTLHSQIVAPIRFTRACTGPPQKDCPDPDDRGFEMADRPRTWGVTVTRGAMVGITVGDTVKVKLLREDIDNSAPLHITSDKPNLVKVVSPDPEIALGSDGMFQLKGVKDVRDDTAIIQVHLGSSEGPIIGELEPHAFNLVKVNVCVHRVTLNGANHGIPAMTGRTDTDIDAMFEIVNTIWRPCGIEFVIKARRTPTFRLTSTTTAITGPRQGCVAIDNSANWAVQIEELWGKNPRRHMVNVYFVSRIWDVSDPTGAGGTTGGAATTMTTGYRNYGVVLPDDSNEQHLAHELGHVLNLDYHGGGNAGHADDNSSTEHFRSDIWTRRRLMYSYHPYDLDAGEPAHRKNVGYGAFNTGCLIAVKGLPNDDTDGELAEARKRAKGPTP
jgi:hypothetical protein